MAKEYIQEAERETVVPPLPNGENDDVAASMVEVDDEAEEPDAAVENRLESEDDEFQDEMDAEADEDAEGETKTE